MPPQRKDGPGGGPSGGPVRTPNGARSGFRTDTAISNNRAGAERNLTRWVADSPAALDGALESSSNAGGKWDQFAANERLFGLKTDYNENYYTTAIDRSHPQYSERLAVAERAAREIEGSSATTAHVAEERVMDFVAGEGQGDGDEEDKYSGVRRQQDFPPLSASARGEAKYTPPARRAPTAHSTVVGAPVDPAIISSQIKGGSSRKQQQQQQQPPPPPAAPKGEENKASTANAPRPAPPAVALPQQSKTPEPKAADKVADGKQQTAPKVADNTSEQTKSATTSKPNSKPSTPAISSGTSSLRATATPNRTSLSPSAKASAFAPSTSAVNSPAPPNVADNVESALLKDFKDFASQQRQHAEKARHNKIKADAQVKLQELRRFADSFKLSTPVPNDLISIIAKDPEKQRQIQEKALQNAEQLAKSKTESADGQRGSASSAGSSKPPAAPSSSAASAAASTASNNASNATTNTSTTPNLVPPSGPGAAAGGASAADNARPPVNNSGRPQGPPHSSHSMSNRHPNSRGGYMQQNFRPQSQPYRGDRSGPQHMSQGHNTGHLAERIRNSEQNQNRYNKNLNNHGPSHFGPSGDARMPPTGPANPADSNYSRRLSAQPSGAHTPQKLNPTTHEFRPSPFAASFNPTGPSAGSSPRSTINPITTDHSIPMSSTATSVPTIPSPRVLGTVLIRRKTQNVSADKCDILTMVRSIKPPPGRNWDENNGLRPSFDTPLLWRQIQDDEKQDSTMHLKYTEYLERVAFSAASRATPVQGHVVPHNMSQMPHQHQLPAHMQHHGGHMGPRPNQHMPPMPIHGGGGPHGHIPQVSFNGSDDHRMMASNSAQSYASPRMSQAPMYPQHATPQMGYNQPAMPFMQNGPQMNQFRNYSNNPQGFMPPQSGPMMPMMPPQHFVAVPGAMMGGQQQMGMYPGGAQFMGPPGAGGAGGAPPPHQMGASNGYPSPGRPVAPMMGQQGSQQGQPMYGQSPNTQYQQPAFNPQHQGQGGKLF
ncbi:pab1-binding protein [Sporothrix schenckii 1099-18]|uniref:Pab1-binding protein n=1 Tax=Sporothrix schenckii 1099-18 TaxID=1397361 RepID=A0A0F2M716_SPOSC|nr:pab1-binding protein [Sporothrix schenckii 1099-18]KJR83946.1 pab1-binding protein [Sporothrix schenckii 1099-18]